MNTRRSFIKTLGMAILGAPLAVGCLRKVPIIPKPASTAKFHPHWMRLMWEEQSGCEEYRVFKEERWIGTIHRVRGNCLSVYYDTPDTRYCVAAVRDGTGQSIPYTVTPA